MERRDEKAMSREGLERGFAEFTGVSLDPNELERLHGRLLATKEALVGLGGLLDMQLEPLPTVVLEDAGSESD